MTVRSFDGEGVENPSVKQSDEVDRYQRIYRSPGVPGGMLCAPAFLPPGQPRYCSGESASVPNLESWRPQARLKQV